MNTGGHSLDLEQALAGLPKRFSGRLLKAYSGLKTAFVEGNFDACGLRAGRFCEVLLRFLQHELTGSYTPFGTRLTNFRGECEKLQQLPSSVGVDSIRIIMPRALSFLYTLRNKRGIGHEGGDIDANEIDAVTAVRVADWCLCELIRVFHSISLEEAQAICDVVAKRAQPQIWEVFGRKRVLDTNLGYTDQTLLFLYSDADVAVPAEDLVVWTEHSNPSVYRRDVLSRLHKQRYVEYDKETQMVLIGPRGIERVEDKILRSLAEQK